MTTFCNTYMTEVEARDAIETLRHEGASPGDLRLLVGRRPGDVRRDIVGGFAGPVGPDAPVGTYGGATVRRHQAAGGFAGDPDHERQGSFEDTDRITIVTFKSDGERTRLTGLRGIRRLLERSGLDDRTVERVVSELHVGRAAMLVDVRDVADGIVPARAA